MIRHKSKIAVAVLAGLSLIVAGPAQGTDDTFKPVTIEWLLAEGSTPAGGGAAYTGGPQTRYDGSCGDGFIQVDTYRPKNQHHVDLINGLGSTLEQNEDRQIPKVWKFKDQTPCEVEPEPEPEPTPTEPPVVVPPVEEPPVEEPELPVEPPTTPVTPPVTPPVSEPAPEPVDVPEVVNPGAVTGLTPEAIEALPAPEREYIESYAKARGIAPTEVLVEWG